MNTLPDDEGASLAAGMESLTFNESSAASSKKPLVRNVTLDPEVPNEAGRPSIDHHVQSTDLMSHMHGLSPNAAPSFRPPIMSLGSVSSTTRQRLSVGNTTPSFVPIAAPPIQNFEIIGTYVTSWRLFRCLFYTVFLFLIDSRDHMVFMYSTDRSWRTLVGVPVRCLDEIGVTLTGVRHPSWTN